MKREILYRGLDKNNHWVYGGAWFWQDIMGERIDQAKIFKLLPDNKGVYRVTGVDVKPETLGQFVMLDGNGQEIYEGDILRATTKKGHFKVGFVEFAKVSFCLHEKKEDEKFHMWRLSGFETIEVIGNLHGV